MMPAGLSAYWVLVVIPRIDAALKIRKAYRDSIPFGKGVIEISNGSAKAEVQVLVKEIEEWL